MRSRRIFRALPVLMWRSCCAITFFWYKAASTTKWRGGHVRHEDRWWPTLHKPHTNTHSNCSPAPSSAAIEGAGGRDGEKVIAQLLCRKVPSSKNGPLGLHRLNYCTVCSPVENAKMWQKTKPLALVGTINTKYLGKSLSNVKANSLATRLNTDDSNCLYTLQMVMTIKYIMCNNYITLMKTF